MMAMSTECKTLTSGLNKCQTMLADLVDQVTSEKIPEKKRSSAHIFFACFLICFIVALLDSGRLSQALDRQAVALDSSLLHWTAEGMKFVASKTGLTALTDSEELIVQLASEDAPELGSVAETREPAPEDAEEKTSENSPNPQTEKAESSDKEIDTTAPKTPAILTTPEPSKQAPETQIPAVVKKPRVLLVGDSMMMEGFGPVLQRILHARPDLEVIREGKYSTGLSRPDYFDWDSHMAELVQRDHPDLVVICLGANDPQDIIAENGKRHHADSESWGVIYRSRAKKLLQIATSGGAKVLWTGLPIMKKEPYSKRIRRLSNLQKEACEQAEKPDMAHFVDTLTALADAKGGYTAFGTDAKGQTVRLRYKDNIHVTEEGGRRMVKRLLPLIFHELGLPESLPQS